MRMAEEIYSFFIKNRNQNRNMHQKQLQMMKQDKMKQNKKINLASFEN